MNKPAILKALRQPVQYWDWPEYQTIDREVDARKAELQKLIDNDKKLQALKARRDKVSKTCHAHKIKLDGERKELYSKFIVMTDPDPILLARIQKFVTRQPDARC